MKPKHIPASKAAGRAYKALLQTQYTIIPEYSLGERLRGDYYIKELRILLEVDGSQHTLYNSFHYDGKDDFRAAKMRDQKKQSLCEQQGLTLIRLTEKEIMATKSPEELLQIIYARIPKTESEIW